MSAARQERAGGAAAPKRPSRAPEPYTRPDLYDVLFSDLDFDKAYYLDLARQAEGPVLDLCCGTGRLLLPMLEAGIDADGVDLEPAMLDRARARATAGGFQPRLEAGDMRDFHLPRRYAAVFIPFNAFAHNLTPADQLATLQCCRRHLEPAGLLAFDAFRATEEGLAEPHTSAVLEREVRHPQDGHPVQIWDGRSFDVERCIQHSRIEIRELDADRRVATVHRFETDVRWIQPEEVSQLLRRAGFEDIRIGSGYAGEPVTDSTNWLVVEARRGSEVDQ
jgi:SAM-dependent methyltransferase